MFGMSFLQYVISCLGRLFFILYRGHMVPVGVGHTCTLGEQV